MTKTKRTIRAPRGTKLNCKNWQIEAAYRMIQNNLDPDVAGDPDNLIVYGGRGKAARNWAAFDAILASLQALEPDETLMVQSGTSQSPSSAPIQMRHECSSPTPISCQLGQHKKILISGKLMA